MAIVGRPNVGKSTLFNRLTESRSAIVDEFSGVTRDRHYGKAHWAGVEFTAIDTGGYVRDSEDVFDSEIRRQVEIAIKEANCVVFMTDVATGITDLDMQVADILRRSDKPVFLAVNKVDNHDRQADAMEFYSLGISQLFMLSSINGSGTGELLDAVVSEFKDRDAAEELDLPRIAVVGKPNAGKSSFVNTLLGEERNIVTPIAGTTRDAIDTHFKGFGHEFLLVDTAGIRKKTKVHEDLEFYSVMRAIKALERADVCIVMIDAVEGIGAQDLNIIHLAIKNRKSLLVLINKWDLIEKETHTARDFEKLVRDRLKPFTDVDVLFVSVLEKQRIHKALECAMNAYENRSRKIKTSELNEYFQPLFDTNPPPALKGKYIQIKFVTQLPTPFPSFAFYCNLPQYVKEPYKRFIENKLREKWNFRGVPVEVFFRKK
jgi:GTP-binding protein